MGEVVVPGQRLGSTDEYLVGPGTYERHGTIHAARLGVKSIVSENGSGERSMVAVISNESGVVPETGSLVIARVVNVNPRHARCEIICVGGTPVSAAFTGMIRSRDVRAFEKDKVEMYKSFRPGDVVRAEVLSLGDSRNYLLTTAKNELGVVYAQSIAGAAMVPISWCEMQCPATSTTEHRKVAKPDMGIADDTIQMQ